MKKSVMVVTVLGAGWWFWATSTNMYYSGPGALGPFQTRELCQAAQQALPREVYMEDGRKVGLVLNFSDCFEVKSK